MEYIYPNLYIQHHEGLPTLKLDIGELDLEDLDGLTSTADTAIGLAGGYNTDNGDLCALAISTQKRILVLTLNDTTATEAPSMLAKSILLNSTLKKYAFNAPRLIISLPALLPSLRSKEVYDLIPKGKFKPHTTSAVISVLGPSVINEETVIEVFDSDICDPEDHKHIFNLALRAWAACHVANKKGSAVNFRTILPFDTISLTDDHISFFINIFKNDAQLDALKPTIIKNDVERFIEVKDHTVHVSSVRYANRIRSNAKNLEIHLHDSSVLKGEVTLVAGRVAKIKLVNNEEISADDIKHIVTTGKEESTMAEDTRYRLLIRAIKEPKQLFQSPFLRLIWYNPDPNTLPWPHPLHPRPRVPLEVDFIHRSLNNSQEDAANAALLLNNENRITILIGPPGSGKTTVIAAIVDTLIQETEGETIWVVAQSNIAVKNIAEKLYSCDFRDFRLLVSGEFIFDWHDHLYAKIKKQVICSDEFDKDIDKTKDAIGSSRVILCTLSMLSSDRMNKSGFPELVPVEILIVDEASQVEIGDYLIPLSRFHNSLQKTIFIGDDKQLAPHGHEDVPTLKSVFEIPHLRENAKFLDTQYRMPHFVGNFLSERMYGGALGTKHANGSNVCCRFVDVTPSRQAKGEDGKSWINVKEAEAIIEICKKYKSERRQYRIITPYDGQRNLIEQMLRKNRLEWEDRCFNVDSFQGNEADNIIISLVRSWGLGFLTNERRMNVMLSRCKQSMLICSSKKYLSVPDVRSTLVGDLASRCEAVNQEVSWISMQDVWRWLW